MSTSTTHKLLTDNERPYKHVIAVAHGKTGLAILCRLATSHYQSRARHEATFLPKFVAHYVLLTTCHSASKHHGAVSKAWKTKSMSIASRLHYVLVLPLRYFIVVMLLSCDVKMQEHINHHKNYNLQSKATPIEVHRVGLSIVLNDIIYRADMPFVNA